MILRFGLAGDYDARVALAEVEHGMRDPVKMRNWMSEKW
jgi:hypothetical protein